MIGILTQAATDMAIGISMGLGLGAFIWFVGGSALGLN